MNWRNWQEEMEDSEVQFYQHHRGDPNFEFCILCENRFEIYKALSVYITSAGPICYRCYLLGAEHAKAVRPGWDWLQKVTWDNALFSKVATAESGLWVTPPLDDKELADFVEANWKQTHNELCVANFVENLK